MHRYEELEVWRLAYALALQIYADTRTFPADERYGLVSQLRRAVVSVVSALAEGAGRATPGEFRNLVSVAAGSIREVECQLRLSHDLGYMTAPLAAERRHTCTRISRMLSRLHQSLAR